MKYESLTLVADYVQWAIAIGTALIILRIIYIIFSMSNSTDEGVSMNSIITKVGIYVKAAITLAIVVGLVELIQSYFFH